MAGQFETMPDPRDVELVRDALERASILVPTEWDNTDVCQMRDAREAFERIVRSKA